MRPHEIEAWAIRIIELVRSGAKAEDARVELKRELIDPARAGRRIAGHANSANGEPILWIIGIDEKRGELVDVKDEIANWWSSVQSRFDGLAPALVDVAIPVDGKTLKALLFTTDRRPFVVKTGVSSPELEVPWRDGTRIRSASRMELVQLLRPVALLPNFEILTAGLEIQEISSRTSTNFQLKLSLRVYVTPKSDIRLVFPFHRASCTCEAPGTVLSLPQVDLREIVPHQSGGLRIGDPQATVKASASELIVTGPGSFEFVAGYATGSQNLVAALNAANRITAKATILPAGTNVSAVLEVWLSQVEATGGNLVAFRFP